MIDLAKLSAPFPPDRISWRIGATNREKTKGMALAYIDSRDVQDRLDEVCGAAGWQCRYPHAGTKTVCEIGLKIGEEWIWKADGAGDSDVEAEKGALSDAFKRSAVKWGIGRYLYDANSPWVEVEPAGRSFKIKDGEYAKLRRSLAGAPVPLAAPPAEKPASKSTRPAKPRAASGKPMDPLVMQAAIVCGEGAFAKFLGVATSDEAAHVVRDRCKIKSRSELATNSEAAAIWRDLVAKYRVWQSEPDLDTPHDSDAARSDPPADMPPQVPAGGEARVFTAKIYTELWDSVIQAATPTKRAAILTDWNGQKAMRDQIEWTPRHPFLPLKQRVVKALEFLKEAK